MKVSWGASKVMRRFPCSSISRALTRESHGRRYLAHGHIHICLSLPIYIEREIDVFIHYIYIYIIHTYMCMYISIYSYIQTCCTYIYIYITASRRLDGPVPRIQATIASFKLLPISLLTSWVSEGLHQA